MDRLTPEQLETLRDQYQGLQDLAASAGIQLQPLPFAEAHNTADNAAADTASSKAAIQDDSNTPNSNKQGNSTLSSTAVRSSSKLRAVAEQVIEYDEGDDKVRGAEASHNMLMNHHRQQAQATGNRQQATGSGQQAAGNRHHNSAVTRQQTEDKCGICSVYS